MNHIEDAQKRICQPPERYVVGYCFNRNFTLVALIEKIKPEWQKGKLNGIGGKIELGEAPPEAMAREFSEEAGVYIPPSDWFHFRTERFDMATEVFHFATVACDHDWLRIRTTTAERVIRVKYPLTARGYQLIYNIPYLVPMAAILIQQPQENWPQP